MSEGSVVLIIDDERQIRRLLRYNLEVEGYRVYEAPTGEEGLAQAAALRPDLVILDLGLPDMDGLDVLKRLREWSHVPVVVLTVHDMVADKVSLLDAGADDYLTKPFSTRVLLARLRVAQRYARPVPDSPLFRSGPLTVDLARHSVSLKDQPINLSTTEYAILRLLVQHAGRVVMQRQLVQEVWGGPGEKHVHYLHVYMGRLRRKIEPDPFLPVLILNEVGIGYRMACLPPDET